VLIACSQAEERAPSIQGEQQALIQQVTAGKQARQLLLLVVMLLLQATFSAACLHPGPAA
jgi:hypothetical protein